MSGWRMAIACTVPVCGALFFLKVIADSLASTKANLESLERAEEKAWRQRQRQQRERAEREARKAQEPQ